MRPKYPVNDTSSRGFMNRVEESRLEQLEPSKLAEVHESLRHSLEDLEQRKSAALDSQEEAIHNRDFSEFEAQHKTLRHLGSRIRNLEALKTRVFNIRQRAIVRRGMERVLGKPGARALEILVLLLIIVVLLILVYQMAVGYDYRPYSYAMLPALSTPAIGSIEGSNNKARGEVDTLLNAMWWSFNAVTTGGFADFYKPTNMVAKLVTGLIVVGGLVVMGVFIATLSAVYRGEDADELHVMQHELQSSIDKLRQSQEELRKQIEDLRSVM